MKTQLEKAIDDIKWLQDKCEDPFGKIAYGIAVSVCELHLEKEKLPNEPNDKRSVATEDASSTDAGKQIKGGN